MNGTAARIESTALVVAIVGFAAGALTGLLVFHGGTPPLSGPGSVGTLTTFTSGAVGLCVFVAGYVLSSGRPGREWRRTIPLWRRIVDIGALALAHAAVAMLAWITVAFVLAHAFIDAAIYSLAAYGLVGGGAAATAYLVFLSASDMTTSRLATVLVVFLVLGVLSATLSESDPHWWQTNISDLGVDKDFSGAMFDFTMIVAGVLITTLSSYLTSDLEASPLTRRPDGTPDPAARRHAAEITVGLIVLGLCMAGVGVFTVDLHTA
ncbi:hypothetical protein FJ656_07575, partial [Schumannella luteola]